VALSYYDFQRKYRQIEDGYPLKQYVDDFVNGRLISRDWGTWAENVASWISTRANQHGFLLLRYEDMMHDTVKELARVADFLGIEPTPDRLRQAIERSSADRMRALEKAEENQWVATKKHRKDIPFVRVAKSGGWRQSLPESCVQKIEDAWGDIMMKVGYELISARVPQGVR
jgi:hypothetical protein